MYYLYLIQSVGGRAGFGITQNPKERNKQYCSHSGDIVQFKFLYGGIRAHAKALESTIKRQYVDNIWMVDDWQTEWLKDGVDMTKLRVYVEDLIKTRHFKLKLTTTDYTFQTDLD